jgi:hypothetical protein
MPKKIGWFLLLIAYIWPILCSAADSPHNLAGFIIGGLMTAHQQKVKPDTILPVRYLESLKEVEIKDVDGYKTGLVSYTTCRTPSRIVRLKFKYADASRSFYNRLLNHVKKRYGQPDTYRGDAFHIIIAWKWSFIDRDGNDISLILQHNTRDDEEKQGNVIKLTMWNLLNEEMDCFEATHSDASRSKAAGFKFNPSDAVDWKQFVPQ